MCQKVLLFLCLVEPKIVRLHGVVSGSVSIAANVLALGAVADFGAENCQYTTKVDAR